MGSAPSPGRMSGFMPACRFHHQAALAALETDMKPAPFALAWTLIAANALAGPTGWQSYEIMGLTAVILKQYLSVHPVR